MSTYQPGGKGSKKGCRGKKGEGGATKRRRVADRAPGRATGMKQPIGADCKVDTWRKERPQDATARGKLATLAEEKPYIGNAKPKELKIGCFFA